MTTRLLSQAGPSKSRLLAFASCRVSALERPRTSRSFSASARASQNAETNSGDEKTKGETHYDTLGIPRGASRMEIKAAYFRLSKRYHPDVRKGAAASRKDGAGQRDNGQGEAVNKKADVEADKRATERFHEVNAAYRVLSDDRQRRAYDRTLTYLPSSSSHLHRSRGHAHTPGSSYVHAYAYELHSRRRRGATHAWEGPRGYTGRTQYTHAGTAHTSSAPGAGRHYGPESSSSNNPFSQFTSGAASGPRSEMGSANMAGRRDERLSGRALRAEEERIEHDRIVRESNVSRFFRAFGIVLVVTWVGSLGKSLGG